MAFYTKIRKKDKKILEKTLNKKIYHIEGIKEGSENSNYFLKFKKKKKILTVLENEKNINETIEIVDFLSKRTFIPKYYRNKKNNSFFFYINKKKSLLSEFKEGKTKKLIKKIDSFKIGIFLSNLHKIGCEIISRKRNCFCYTKIGKYIKTLKKKIDRKTYSLILKIYKRNISFISSKVYIKLPECLCHCDLFKDNVLFKKKSIGSVLDFHFSCVEKRLYDISIHINEWCFEKKRINFKKIKYFLVGYSKYTKMKKKEYLNIYNFMLVTSLRFLITRLIGNKIHKKKKKSTKHYINMIRFYLDKKKEIKKRIKKLYIYDRKFLS
ncbi:Homoserine kinase [Candidatus Vidania fulgoroideae]|nr:Homoserine kinase [Candidatus Vidania fulgoroideae]